MPARHAATVDLEHFAPRRDSASLDPFREGPEGVDKRSTAVILPRESGDLPGVDPVKRVQRLPGKSASSWVGESAWQNGESRPPSAIAHRRSSRHCRCRQRRNLGRKHRGNLAWDGQSFGRANAAERPTLPRTRYRGHGFTVPTIHLHGLYRSRVLHRIRVVQRDRVMSHGELGRRYRASRAHLKRAAYDDLGSNPVRTVMSSFRTSTRSSGSSPPARQGSEALFRFCLETELGSPRRLGIGREGRGS